MLKYQQLWYLNPPFSHKKVKDEPSLTKLSGSAHDIANVCILCTVDSKIHAKRCKQKKIKKLIQVMGTLYKSLTAV